MIWWIVGEKITTRVVTNEAGIIEKTGPISKKFRGQPIGNLINWMNRISQKPLIIEKRESA